jgi:hypothetical protein
MRALREARKRIPLSLIVETTTVPEMTSQTPYDVVERGRRSFWIPEQPM